MTRWRKIIAAVLACLVAVVVADQLTIDRRALNSTLSLYEELAGKYFSERGRQAASGAQCQNIRRKAVIFDYQMVECQTATTCGPPVSLIFLFSRISGAFIEQDQFSRFAKRCPEMLTDAALAEFSATARRGGE